MIVSGICEVLVKGKKKGGGGFQLLKKNLTETLDHFHLANSALCRESILKYIFTA